MARISLERLRQADWLLLFAVFALVLIGLAAIYSVELSQGDGQFLQLKKQAVAVVVSACVYAFAASSNYRLLRNYSLLLYSVGVVLMLAVLLFGSTIHGTTGWFTFGLISFQPVEFMKFALAVALAAYFSSRGARTAGWKELLHSGVIVAIPAGLTMLQPDFGSAFLLLSMWGFTILFAGLKKRYVFALGIFGILAMIFSWEFLFAEYQKDRILTFLDPSRDPLGQGYHVTQAIIAVGAGGWFGRGLGFGSQSQLKFLPESQTDFIFAVVAEELGFFGICLVLAGFLLVFQRMYMLASRTRDEFTGFLLVAIGALFFAQFVVNVGMNIGLLPVTGVTLPLVSYGGSSLVFTLWMLGVVQSVAVHAGILSHAREAMVE
jgi:rod shape determining protein RodA